MRPLIVTAHLDTPPVILRPVYLDGLLVAGVGARCSVLAPAGWAAREDVGGEPLPLAKVATELGWWWAASAVTPRGREVRSDLNRTPAIEEQSRWTRAKNKTMNVGTGPDKRLRVPYFYRPEMMTLRWSCVGDADQIADLLARIPSVGRLAAHGHGWVRRWDIAPGGPEASAYARDLNLRHLPVGLDVEIPRNVSSRLVPLRPPYYRRRDAEMCWQVQS